MKATYGFKKKNPHIRNFWRHISVCLWRYTVGYGTRRCERRGGGSASTGDLWVTDGPVQERQKEKRKKKQKNNTHTSEEELFSCWDLNCYLSNKLMNKKAATTDRFLYTYYIHVYIYTRTKALVAFTVLDKWGYKLEDQEQQWKIEAPLTDSLSLSLFLLFSHHLSAVAELWLLEVTEVSISNSRTASISPLRDQRTKHFYCSEQWYMILMILILQTTTNNIKKKS